nr:hypothetical protein [Candidatus Sigynarchaeum springense]
MAYFSFVPVVIIFLGITLKPLRAFAICAVGAVVGELLADIIFGWASYLWLYLPGAFVARGLEGLVLSLLEMVFVRNKELSEKSKRVREAIIILIGGIWEFFGYVTVASVLTGMEYGATIIYYLWVLIDLTLIPAGIAVLYGVRRYYKTEFFDKLLFNDLV